MILFEMAEKTMIKQVTVMLYEFKFFGVFIVLILFSALPAFGQSPSMIAAAKQEGEKAVAYGSLESDTTNAISSAFQKKTGLTMEYWRASATKVLDRALSEYRAGKPLFDVVLTNSAPMHILLKAHIFARYESPSDKNFPKDVIDPFLGPRYRNIVIGIVYNKSGISPADAPKSLEDLLKPQYKGKLVMPDPTQHNHCPVALELIQSHG